MLKRIFDIFASFFGLIILSPILFFTALLSYLFQGGPILFFHRRLGKDATPFTMIKFRTMLKGPSKSAENDVSRLTLWGRFLRRWSLDELTVFYNVFKGDMSIVGPRPLPVKYLDRFNFSQRKRMDVKPGITGLAQINGRNHLSWEERFSYDIKYINTQSLLLDFLIIFKTFFLVIYGKNVKAEKQEIMPEFMGSLDLTKKRSKVI